MLEQSRLGFGIINAKFTFFNKILLFSSNLTVSSVEITPNVEMDQIPLRFIRLDSDHKLVSVVLMSTFKKKNILRTIEAEIS